MKHREQARALHKRARILEVTMRLALEGGLGAVTHRKVSEAADVSLSAIRYYYRNREDLLLACIDEAERVRSIEAKLVIDTLDGPVADPSRVAQLLLHAYYGAEVSDADLAGILRFTVDCSRETSQIAAALARIREESINPQLTELLSSCGWSVLDVALASAVLDGSILASTAEGRSGIADRAVAALAGVLQLARDASASSA